MIISEKQVMQLMAFTTQYIELLQVACSNQAARDQHDRCTLLLSNIANQQSEQLKVIE